MTCGTDFSGNALALGQVGLGEQRLLGERPRRSEVGDAGHAGIVVGALRGTGHDSDGSAAMSHMVSAVREWTLEEATAELPRVRGIVQRIRELVALARERAAASRAARNGVKPSSNGHGPKSRTDTELQRPGRGADR